MAVRWRVPIGVVLAAALATRALGSGDPTPRPVYVFADPQDATERAALAGGRLPIVKGATTDALLFLDWRRLTGLQVGQSAADALVAPCCGTPATRQHDWLDVRRTIPGATEVYWIAAERNGPNFVAIPTCFDDAFTTAAATLADRARRYGRAAPAVRAWLDAQDAVFAACSKPVAALAPLPAAAPSWLRSDRAYQEAALALYNGQADEAARRFAAIAGDVASPWRPSGLYLSARALLRAAIDAPAPARLAAAHAALDRLAAAPAGTFGRGELMRMRQILAFHEHPDRLLLRLDRDLNAPAPLPEVAVAVRDYLTLADRHPAKPEAADWIRTIQAKDRVAASTHAQERWNAGHRTAWLIAALLLADPADAGAAALAEAAGRVPATDPAWLTARYHRLRLLTPRADAAQIRAEADAVLARDDLIRSDRNVFKAVRTQTAASLADFAAHALRAPYCRTGLSTCTADVRTAGDGLIGRRPSGGFAGLGPDARAVIDRLPLHERMAVADMTAMPREIRLDIALTSFVRAVQLRDDAAVDRLAARLVTLLPQVAADWRRIAATPPGADKLFAEAFVMMKIPSLRVDLADYARPTGTVRQFGGYWVDLLLPLPGQHGPSRPFPPASAYLPNGYWSSAYASDREADRADLACLEKCGSGILPLHYPPFVRATLPRALAERRAFIVSMRHFDDSGRPVTVQTAGISLWNSALTYVVRHPGDPRAAEALYRLIRVARWGGNHDHLGRRAFLLLHRRYPRSGWTARSPFYYD
ncbi:hypothetical protein MC45_02550 [Sphingomonas taxi]|uniref:Uncharacterized protein n=1 Tax=Sphingomonas taxi TaxID=1549858 RepID=A0A097ED11_9SPHN|nr:hypothetical protein [Sphingomonas taxi]AIT05464.1 hypothetical protein MC45_02550 [Sphingomonas taxi]